MFQLLEKNGMEQEKKQVLQMADYIDSMETKMEDVLSELKSMREQLSGIENQSFRTKAEKIVAAVEGKLGDMADELHAARQHLGNAGRTLTGRKMRKAVSRDPERGAVYEVQRLMFQSMVSMERMERRTENLLERMDRLSAKEEKGRTSVRKSIRELRADQPTVQEPLQKQRSETVRG